MLDSTNVSTVLTSAANLGSDSLLARSQALFQLNFLSGSNNPFQNGSVFSSSSGGSLYLGEGIHIVTTGAEDDQIYVGSGND